MLSDNVDLEIFVLKKVLKSKRRKTYLFPFDTIHALTHTICKSTFFYLFKIIVIFFKVIAMVNG